MKYFLFGIGIALVIMSIDQYIVSIMKCIVNNKVTPTTLSYSLMVVGTIIIMAFIIIRFKW